MSEVSFYPIQDIWFYLLAAFILEALAVYVLQFRRSPGALPLAGGLLNRAVWLTSLVVIGTSPNLADKLFWVTIQQMTVILPAFFWLLFFLQITHRRHWINKKVLAALLLVPVLILLLLFTNPWYGLYWRQISLDGEVLTMVRGFGNWLMIFYNGFLILPTLYLSIGWIRQCTGLRRLQAIIVMLAPLSGAVGTFIWLFVQHTGILSPMPLSTLITGIVWTYGFFYLRVINLLPLAQAKAVEVVGNGLAVIDNEGWIVDMNVAAAGLLGITPAQTQGRKAAEIFKRWPSLAALLETGEATREICYKQGDSMRYYELHIIKLVDWGGGMGKAFVWKEITAQRKAQTKLIEQQKALSILAERNRIGREIHDGPGQLGGYLQMELQTILILLDKERIKDAKEQIRRLLGVAREFNIDVRETIADLKTGALKAQDFLQFLEGYLARYQKNYSIQTDLVLPAKPLDGLFDPVTKLQLLRIIQEALNNVRKHAKAKRVSVGMEVFDKEAVVTIFDDGQGFDLSMQPLGKNHYGLTIMQERAKEAGGTLRVESKPGAGTRVIIEIPIGKVEQHEGIVG